MRSVTDLLELTAHLVLTHVDTSVPDDTLACIKSQFPDISAEDFDFCRALCNALRSEPFEDAIDSAFPFLIADRSAWEQASDRLTSMQKLDLLRAILIAGPHESDFATIQSDCPTLPFAKIASAWSSAFFLPLEGIPTAADPRISSALDVYHTNFLSSSDLLSDYANDLRARARDPDRVTAVRSHRRRQPRTTGIECGRSEIDRTLSSAICALRDLAPTSVIQDIFYTGLRSDCRIELSLAYKAFRSLSRLHSKRLIVNPSPVFVKEWAHLPEAKNTVFAVTDRIIRALYQAEFPDCHFAPLGTDLRLWKKSTSSAEGTHPVFFDAVLLFIRDHTPDDIFETLKFALPSAKIMCLCPEICITSTYTPPEIHHLSISAAIQLPPNVSASKPRKKIFLIGSLSSPDPGATFPLLTSTADEQLTYLIPSKEWLAVPYSALRRGRTLTQIRKDLLSPSAHIISQAHSSIYSWSSEIDLNFTYKKRGEYICGRVCYRKKLTSEERKSRAYGCKLTPYSEQGLRVKNIEDLSARLDRCILTNGFFVNISEDILQFYEHDLSNVSLKTLFCCTISRLQMLVSYDSTIMEEIFCGPDQSVSHLCVGSTTGDQLLTALDRISGPDGTKQQGAYLRQLHLLLRIARDENLLHGNEPLLLDFLPAISKRQRHLRQEVRDVWARRTFAASEISALLSYLYEPYPDFPDFPRFAVDSLWLIPLIRLTCGLNLREICALYGSDLVPCAPLNRYSLRISRMRADDGRIILLSSAHPNRLRCVPVTSLLQDAIDVRKAFIHHHHPNLSDRLRDLPLIWSSDPRTKQPPTPCTIDQARTVSREAIAIACADRTADVIRVDNSDEEPTDLSTFYGDYFQSTLAAHARHSGFTPGELAFVLGIAPPAGDTFSSAYADYAAPLYQQIMRIKLERWTSFIQTSLPLSAGHTLTQIHGQDGLYISPPSGPSPNRTTLTIVRTTSGCTDTPTIHISCPHGFRATITTI